jgi:glycerate 2-kinase
MTDLKEEARNIFLNTLKEIDLEQIISRKVKVSGETLFISDQAINLSDYKEIVLIGFGKASLKMGAAFEKLLGDRLTRGILVADKGHAVNVKSEVIIASHPVPDGNSLRAGGRIMRLADSCGEDSLIIFLVSGGGSALVESPLVPEIGLEDLSAMNRTLVGCGATIREINVVRKHFSGVKGGRLGYIARKCASVALYVSDVNPGDLRSVASNPLLPDDATLDEFLYVIRKHGLAGKLPEPMRTLLESGKIPELPRDWTGEGKKGVRLLLLDNTDCLRAAADLAESRGFLVEVDYGQMEGPYEDVAWELIERLKDFAGRFAGRRVCLISGGEVSCPVRGDGAGGRNQEFVLYSATRLAELKEEFNAAVLSCGTDGIDGNSNAAGAVADANTIRSARRAGLDVEDYLRRSDSHSFFNLAGGLILTGPTGNNVRDIRVLLAGNS